MVQEPRGREEGKSCLPLSPPSPFCSCTRHTHLGNMQVGVSPGETVDCGHRVSYRDNPCAWQPAFPVPCSLAAQAAAEGRGGSSRARAGGGRGRGRCASWCHPSRCAPVASGFQLRQPSPGFCGLSLFKSMNHGGAHGKSFYRNEHIVSIPAELFWGQQMEKMRCADPSCLGQALLLGDEGSGSNS